METNQKNFKQCDMCKDTEATSLCPQCFSYYCDGCYKQVHERKKNKDHKKEPIDFNVPIDTWCPQHEKNAINLFCIDEKELCCSYCYYLNLHNGHKVVPIEDEETLKKENINVNDYIKEFEFSAKNVESVKEKIEKEINKINELYEKMDKEVTKSFELKHEKLIKEEKEMKDKLDNEVTKIKSKLEENLSLVNNLLRNYEKINKGIQGLHKEGQNSNIKLLKNLTYVSKINKNQKEMKKFSQMLVKNLKLEFIDDKINYEEYYFNGLSIPKEIRISNIKSNSCNISWKIDDINILNIDKNKIKYKIEIRKEDEQFKSIYEDKNMNYFINNLDSNTNYEIKICTLYDNISSNYSDIIKFKTNKFDSILLNETNKCNECLKKIYEWTGGKNMELLYRGTRDGMSVDAFHNKCNNKGPTICLFKNEKSYIFRGYASIDWQGPSQGICRSASDSFIFTLTNMYNIPPTKFPNSNTNDSIWDDFSYGPCFSGYCDIAVQFNSNCTNFPNAYKDVLGKGYSIFKGDNDNNQFILKEIEVFKLIK